MSDRPYVITLTRTVAVTPPELHRAWTEPQILERWLAPVVLADARPGGVFRCTLPDGSALDGTYDEVIAGERIGLVLRPPGGDPAGERIVIAMFAVTRDISELEISERWGGPPPSPEQVTARTARWQRLLDQLVEGIEPAATLDPDA